MKNFNFNKKINVFELKYLFLSLFIVFGVLGIFLILFGNDTKYSDENEIDTEKIENNENKKFLYSFISENAILDNMSSRYVESDNGINFSLSSNDKNGIGLYTRANTVDDKYPIHYYRGSVDNNNVVFGGFCWLIVRTTDTGGIKLLYNGKVEDDGTCNNRNWEDGRISDSIYNDRFNNITRNLAHVGYMYGNGYGLGYDVSLNDSFNYLYGNDIKYENGKYILKDTYMIDKNNYNELYYEKLHYSCFTTDNSCEKVYYVRHFGDRLFYFTLTDGKTPYDIYEEMLSNSNNTNDSIIKQQVDDWYSKNLIKYTNYLEDTVWCNDRSGWESDVTENGKVWNVNFGAYKRYKAKQEPIVICPNKNDSFTVDDEVKGNGDLTYPVGLLTLDELILTSNFSFGNKDCSWTMSPYFFWIQGLMFDACGTTSINEITAIRPSVSLKNSTVISRGSGSVNNHYVVE